MKGISQMNLVKTKNLVIATFIKTHIQWNNLPLEIKIIEDYEKFKAILEQKLWDSIMEPEHHEISDLSFELPGD